MTGYDSDNDALVRIVEECVPCEIMSHFSSMTVYRCLRDGECNIIDDDDGGGGGSEEKYACCIFPSRRGRLGMDFLCCRDVHKEGCTTRVLSCVPAQKLLGYCVLWAESTVRVCVSEIRASKLSRRERLRRFDGESIVDEGKKVQEEERKEKQHKIKFLSLHIVDHMAQEDPMRHSFALQSVCQPGRVLQLECYPYHMIYFGFLIYAIWRCPDGLFDKTRERKQQSQGSIAHLTEGLATAYTSSLSPEPLQFLQGLLAFMTTNAKTATETPGVLLLGLGGNVIGNFLDAVVSVDVPIDVVEVEPAVLETCKRHGQIPPCEAQIDTTGNDVSVWIVSQGHRRHPHYRFILGDAEVVLQENMKTGKDGISNGLLASSRYSLVFLDCYDPSKERMLHEGGLIDVCRSHLASGGALIVNAHILPTRESLEEQFLSRGFASVQVLRIVGSDQSIVVCLVGEGECNTAASCKEETRRDRFGVRQVSQMARYIKRGLEGPRPDAQRLFGVEVWNYAGWLKSSRWLRTPSCAARVWEHHD